MAPSDNRRECHEIHRIGIFLRYGIDLGRGGVCRRQTKRHLCRCGHSELFSGAVWILANDIKGNPTIANGSDSSASVQNFQARLNFNGDGRGTASGTWMSMPPPPPAKAAAGAGTFSYSFTHTPVANNSFITLPTPGTYKGTVDYGPSAGLQFAIEESYHRAFQLSNDQKSGTVATSKPEIERLTYTQESKTVTLSRICFVAGSLTRLD